jgi:WD40 repeat protein
MFRLLLIVTMFLSSTLVLAAPPVPQPADPLPPGAVARFGSVRLLHGPHVEWLKFLADGKTIASCDEEKVRLWDLSTGRLQSTSPLPYAVSSPMLLPDGTVMAAFVPGARPPTIPRRHALGQLGAVGAYGLGALGAGLGALGAFGGVLGAGGGIDSNARFQVIDSRSGKVRLTLPGKISSPPDLVSSPDGRFMAIKSGDAAVVVREFLTGKKIARLRPPKGQPFGELMFSADGKLLVGLHQEKTSVWDIEKQQQLASRELPGDSASQITGAFSPDSQTLAVSWSGSVHLYDARTLAEKKDFKPVPVNCMALVFVADGKELIGVTEASQLMRWSMKGEQIGQAVQIKAHGRGWTVSNDAALLAFARDTGQIHLLDLRTGRERAIPERRPLLEDTVCLPSGNVASATEDGEVVVWDPKDGHEISKHQLVEYDPTTRLRLSPNGQYALRHHAEDKVTVHDVASGKVMLELEVRGPVEFSPDGRLLATGLERGVWKLWDVARGKAIRTLEKEDIGRVIAFAPDGRTFTLAAARGATVYEVATGSPRGIPFRPAGSREGELEPFVCPPDPVSALYSRDGKSLIIIGDRQLRIFSTTDSRLLWHIPLEQQPYLVGVSADGRWLASADRDQAPSTIWIRDLGSKKPAKIVHELRVHMAELTSLGFTADGKYLVSSSIDGTALAWDVAQFVAAVERSVPPDEALLSKWWNLLADSDPKKTSEAMQGFEGFPTQSVAFLRTRLRPAEGPKPGRIAELIRDLDASRFATRQRAMQELEELRELAEPQLEAVLKHRPALELANRVKQLLEKLDEPLTDPERLRQLRAVELLERIGTPEAKKLLENLAGGVPEAILTREAKASLHRLSR